MSLRIVAVAATLALFGFLSIARSQAHSSASREEVAPKPAFKRIGLTPPSCDDSKRVVLKTLTNDAAVRHEQSAHWIRHNFKGYQMKPKCALVQIR
jgi:hypothetical protein